MIIPGACPVQQTPGIIQKILLNHNHLRHQRSILLLSLICESVLSEAGGSVAVYFLRVI
jgi:hypothetical protein